MSLANSIGTRRGLLATKITPMYEAPAATAASASCAEVTPQIFTLGAI
jgi:hypothetical protein